MSDLSRRVPAEPVARGGGQRTADCVDPPLIYKHLGNYIVTNDLVGSGVRMAIVPMQPILLTAGFEIRKDILNRVDAKTR